jgi:hypothetical protein
VARKSGTEGRDYLLGDLFELRRSGVEWRGARRASRHAKKRGERTWNWAPYF